jgi:hypothetical protein
VAYWIGRIVFHAPFPQIARAVLEVDLFAARCRSGEAIAEEGEQGEEESRRLALIFLEGGPWRGPAWANDRLPVPGA